MAMTSQLHENALRWYAEHRRDLPWRAPDVDAWGVLVSEVMLQQTPVSRVAPLWRRWQARWPSPADLAEAAPADVLRAWDRLGYPRRALRLLDCARAVVDRHGGQVPTAAADLLALPGVGAYTAAAVAAFSRGARVVVLDTNIRRVLGRVLGAEALPPPSQSRAESARAEAVLPADAPTSAAWNAAVMELGALVCTARAPKCDVCPLERDCAWRAAGYPADAHAARRRTQTWHGSDRQARGALMAVLRAHPAGPAPAQLLASAWPDAEQRDRALASLMADGLVEQANDGPRLPTGRPDTT